MYIILYQYDKPKYRLPCAGFAMDPDTEDLIYLELVSGAVQPVNAIWAHLRRNWRTTQLAATNLYIYDEHRRSQRVYIIPKQKRHYGNKGAHYFMMHEGFDKLHLEYLLGGSEEEPSPLFARALKQYVDVPFLSHWTNELWKAGILASLINKTKSLGMTAWQLYNDAEQWQQLVLKLRQQGGLPVG